MSLPISFGGIIPAGAGLTLALCNHLIGGRDHPRGCGAHLVSDVLASAAEGSSPRVRGSPRAKKSNHVSIGIIPAGAGLTHSQIHEEGLLWDHPRGCGAHDQSVERGWQGVGSSPRVRGSLAEPTCIKCQSRIIPAGAGLTTQLQVHPHRASGSSPRVRGSLFCPRIAPAIVGIIPAGAGLTSHRCPDTDDRRDHPRGCGAHNPLRLLCQHSRDHPRGCGAHIADPVSCAWPVGSSPRVRGSRRTVLIGNVVGRIIPAGAGLTSCCPAAYLCMRDHPRGCGAHTNRRQSTDKRRGSSPRVRGSRAVAAWIGTNVGIIPAGAGLTAACPSPDGVQRDHPRGCGAHLLPFVFCVSKLGSSPRVRGSRISRDGCHDCPGIIPAGAGLTRPLRPRKHPAWDHPRGCGAHIRRPTFMTTTSGSSPRVRGSQIPDVNNSTANGIIPAGAGLTPTTAP